MNNRIKEIRTSQGLSQAKFGEKLGLSQNYIWLIERGDRTPSNRTIYDICQKFDVNAEWLKNGTGEMFREKTKKEAIAGIMADVLNDDTSYKARLINALAALDEKEWEMLAKLAVKLIGEQ